MIDFNADHFLLFKLPRLFRIDSGLLDQHYRALQAQIHPDRFANACDSERRLSLQWATQVNEAYQSLKTPLRRAQYLLLLAGHELDTHNNTAMPSDFLIEQMDWREAVAEARLAHEQNALEKIYHQIKQQIATRYEELASLLDDQHNYVLAADRVRRLMFLEKLLFEIDDAMAAIEN